MGVSMFCPVEPPGGGAPHGHLAARRRAAGRGQAPGGGAAEQGLHQGAGATGWSGWWLMMVVDLC